MDFNKDIVRNCPGCNSANIKGSISIKDGGYSQKINCQECSYTNNRPIGESEDIKINEGTIDEE